MLKNMAVLNGGAVLGRGQIEVADGTLPIFELDREGRQLRQVLYVVAKSTSRPQPERSRVAALSARRHDYPSLRALSFLTGIAFPGGAFIAAVLTVRPSPRLPSPMAVQGYQFRLHQVGLRCSRLREAPWFCRPSRGQPGLGRPGLG